MAATAFPLIKKSLGNQEAPVVLPSAEKLLRRFGHLFTAVRLLILADRMEGLEQARFAGNC